MSKIILPNNYNKGVEIIEKGQASLLGADHINTEWKSQVGQL